MDAGTLVPPTLYHGTTRRFSAFAKEGVEPRFDTAQSELGFFFTDDLDYALRYARGRNGRILTVSLSIHNPKVEEIRRSGQSFIDVIEMDWRAQDATAYVRELRSLGHDGIIFRTRHGYSEYVAFSEGQITILYNEAASDLRQQAAPSMPRF